MVYVGLCGFRYGRTAPLALHKRLPLLNPLDSKGNYNATSNNTKLVTGR